MTALQDTSFAPRVVTIGLLWHSTSSDNLGVGALTLSQVEICRQAAALAGCKLRFVVFGTVGSRSYRPVDVDIRQGGHISIKEILKGRSAYVADVRRCDLVLDIGEGDSFADIYGWRRFLFQGVSKLVVLVSGKPLLLSPQTIGPFKHWIARSLAVYVMRRCAGVFARDGLSFAYLDSLGLRTISREAIDVAFRLPYDPPQRAAGSRCRIGINVSGLLFSGGYEGHNQFGLTLDYALHVRNLIRHWADDPTVEVWLIAHVLADDMPRDDDQRAIATLAQEFPTVQVAPAFASPSEAKSFIAGMDFMTGARMHACIAAFSAGVPVVPLAYSRKFNGLFNSLGYPWFADGKAMDDEQAVAKVIEGYARRAELAEIIRKGQIEAEKRLQRYEDQLVILLRRASGQHGASDQ